ncbi:MAG TPA: amidohydrolase family protein [Iamia sp.]|nr:amidohydrolase family protein [Iamia sp.]
MAVAPVIDAQVHLNLLGSVDAAVAAMDAVGVDGVVIDEWWGMDRDGVRLPHYRRPDGTVRHTYPFSTEAVARFPDRFAYTGWVDRDDPALDDEVAAIAANPQQVAIRVVLYPNHGDDQALEAGAYDRLFAAVGRHDVPVKVIVASTDVARRKDLLFPLMQRFEEVRFVVDHCGVILLSAADEAAGLRRPSTLEHGLAYAELPNVAVQWAHAPTLSAERFPFADVEPWLRRFVDAYGADRVLWAGDVTHLREHHTWAEALYAVALAPSLTDDERAAVLGGTASRLYRWPAGSPTGEPLDDYRASTWREQPMQARRAGLDARRR